MEDYGYSNYKLFLSGDLQGFENIVKYYRNNLIFRTIYNNFVIIFVMRAKLEHKL